MVSNSEETHDHEVEQANSRLTEGLKNCRAVISSYRSLIVPEQASDAEQDEAGTDEPDGKKDDSA